MENVLFIDEYPHPPPPPLKKVKIYSIQFRYCCYVTKFILKHTNYIKMYMRDI